MTNVRERLLHIRKSIDTIRQLFEQKTFDEVYVDDLRRLAFERLLEIISEASRYIPEHLKALHPTIPWRSIADTGNFLRHVYDKLDRAILKNVAEIEIGELSIAIDDLLERFSESE